MVILGSFPTIAYEAETYPTPLEIKAEKLAQAIKHKESKGNYTVKGASGEHGAYQFLPSTFKALSLKHFGTTTAMTPQNQDKVAYKTIISLLEAGHSEDKVALYWNTGRVNGKCSSGINKHGVSYNSCEYVRSVMSIYSSM